MRRNPVERQHLHLSIRRACPDEADALCDLIMRAKAHWGYEPALLALWGPGLTLDADTIAREPVFCAEAAGTDRIVGMSHIYLVSAQDAYLDRLFVDPAAMGQGVGAALVRHALAWATAQGAREVRLHADPNAHPFYERMGATVIGWSESSDVAGRRQPHMRFTLPPA